MKTRILTVIILFHLVLSVVTAFAAPHTIMPWRGSHAAAVSLTFDDGYTSQHTIALPAINGRGLKGTFFLTTDLADYLNAWDWWKEAADAGHEIASHSKTHSYLTALPLSEAEFEIATSQTLIDQKITGQKTVTFAYPYGDLNTEVEALVKKYYIGARGLGETLNNASTDNYNEASYDVANYTVSQMEDLTDQAVSQKKWLIPCFHSFDPGEYGGWSTEQFLAYLDYLKGRTDLWIAPFGTVIKYVRERGAATLGVVTQTSDTIMLNLADTLDDAVFDCPLTVRSEVPASWSSVKMQQGATVTTLVPVTEESIRVVYFDAIPDKGIITLTVVPANQSPAATKDSYSTNLNTTLTVAAPGVLGNDSDPEGATLTTQLVSGTSHGTLTLNSNGSFTYTPVAGYAGSDSFTYRASDGALTSGSATVNLTVTSTGNVLFADDFTRSISPPAPLSPWTAGMGSWAVTSGVLNGSGTAFDYSHIYYAPTPLWDNYAVEAGFKYASSAFGGGLGCRLNPATGAQYAAWIYPDNSAAGHNLLVLGKMWDWTTYSGTPMAQVNLTSVGTGWHTLKMVCDGNRIQVYYDGTARIDVTDNNYDSRAPYLSGGIGMAMWTFDTVSTMSVDTVVVSTLVVNQSPLAVNDTYSTTQSTALTVAAPGVLGNDSDPEGATLTAQLVTGTSHGTLTLNSNGSFTYTPVTGYVGSDSFTYRASDGALTSNTATVTVTVIPPNQAPVAGNDSYSTNQSTALTVAAPGVLGNDTDPEGATLTAQLVSGPSHGTLTLNSNGSFTYTPTAGFAGSDSFTYRASDGTLTSNTATVTITVIPPNQPPVAGNDSYSTPQSTTLTTAAPGVLGNDTDPEGTALTAQLVTGTSHGTLALNSNGSFTYTPVAGYVGSDSFTYRASDGALTSGSATVNLTVTSTGNVLFADDFTRSANPPAPLSPWISVMGSWSVANGVLQGSGSMFNYSMAYYAPTPLWDNYAVEAGFKYASSAFGGGLGCRLNPATGAQYAAWIYPDNSAAGHNLLVLGKMWDWTTYSGTPMAQVNLTSVGTGWHTLKMVCDGNRIQVYYDGTARIDVTDNNYDSRPPYLTGGIGMAMWTFDTVNTMSVDTVVVSTLVVNQPPLAVNDTYSTTQSTALTVAAPGVLGNDTDPEGATLTAQLVSGPSHGTLTLNSNGSFTYTPTAGYTGSDSFTYRASDGATTGNEATVAISIIVNTAVKTTSTLTINLTGTLPANTGIAGAMFSITLPADVTPALTSGVVTAGVVAPSGTFAGGIQTSPVYTPATASTPGIIDVILASSATAGATQVGEVATITLQLSNGATPTANSFAISNVSVIDATLYDTIRGMNADVASVIF